jgi:hypothetical protein
LGKNRALAFCQPKQGPETAQKIKGQIKFGSFAILPVSTISILGGHAGKERLLLLVRGRRLVEDRSKVSRLSIIRLDMCRNTTFVGGFFKAKLAVINLVTEGESSEFCFVLEIR